MVIGLVTMGYTISKPWHHSQSPLFPSPLLSLAAAQSSVLAGLTLCLYPHDALRHATCGAASEGSTSHHSGRSIVWFGTLVQIPSSSSSRPGTGVSLSLSTTTTTTNYVTRTRHDQRGREGRRPGCCPSIDHFNPRDRISPSLINVSRHLTTKIIILARICVSDLPDTRSARRRTETAHVRYANRGRRRHAAGAARAARADFRVR